MFDFYSKTLTLQFISCTHKERQPEPYANSKRLYNTFVFYVRGSHSFQLEDGRVISPKTGDVLFIPQRAAYTNYPSQPDIEFYHVDFRIWDTEGESTFLEDWSILESTQTAALFPLFQTIYEAYSENQPFSSLFCHEIMCQLMRQICKIQYTQLSSSHEFKQIRPIVTYLSEHFTEDTPVTKLADMADISVSTLEKTFRRHFHLSPVSYRNHLRIEQAKRLLTNGVRVSETALAVGFSDIYYFSRMFKQITGISPSEYAKSNRL